MDDHNIINIGLRIIKRCGMYTKEYKNWISCINTIPNSFKDYWANGTALINQTAVLTLQHGYSMTAVKDHTSVALYNLACKLWYCVRRHAETMKSQADSLVAMQTFNSSTWPLVNSLQAASTPLLSSNACSTTKTNATVAVKTAAVVSHNIRP
jgi:hypothetical protein